MSNFDDNSPPPPDTPGLKTAAVDSDIRQHMLTTYVWLRRMMAIITGLFLIVLLWYRYEGGEPPRDSISAYYHHEKSAKLDLPMRDVFIAVLSSIALLLVSYQGYTDGENRLLNLGGFGLLCVVFFPMDHPNSSEPASRRATVHAVSALVFFGSIALVSIFYARNTLALVSTEARRKHYLRAYRLTGALMIALPIAAVVTAQVMKLTSTVFWVEVAGVAAFLAYWLIKSLELANTRLEVDNRLGALPKSPPAP
jgi:hypothetical protein